MEQRVIWDHLESAGAEYVKFQRFTSHMEVNGTVLLVDKDQPHHVTYDLKLGMDWKTKKVKIYQVGNADPFVVQAEKEDKWYVNGIYDENLDGATNIDMTISPLSNMLPINRVSWNTGERRTFKMVYIDVLKQEVKPLLQVYTYLGDTNEHRIFQYRCRDFETAIVVDHDGWVVEYPGAFLRRACVTKESDLILEGQRPLLTQANAEKGAFY